MTFRGTLTLLPATLILAALAGLSACTKVGLNHKRGPADGSVLSDPQVLQVVPPNGPDVGGTPISITGQNFQGGATVTVGGQACGNLKVVSATLITCVTPSHAPGAVAVAVINPDLKIASRDAAFDYVQAVRAQAGFAFSSGGQFHQVNGLIRKDSSIGVVFSPTVQSAPGVTLVPGIQGVQFTR